MGERRNAVLPHRHYQRRRRDRGIARVIDAACLEVEAVGSTIGGIHLEGPFLSPEEGPRGAHDSRYIKAPDWALFARWQAASGNRIRIVTLSPEWPDAASFIRSCVESGIVVSIGHTARRLRKFGKPWKQEPRCLLILAMAHI